MSAPQPAGFRLALAGFRRLCDQQGGIHLADGVVVFHKRVESPLPVAILPLGAGNDLSRVLQWGGGFSKFEGPTLSIVLHDVDHAAVTMVDCWKVDIKKENPNGNSNQANGNSNKTRAKFMMNYLGIECDAKVAYEIHVGKS